MSTFFLCSFCHV